MVTLKTCCWTWQNPFIGNMVIFEELFFCQMDHRGYFSWGDDFSSAGFERMSLRISDHDEKKENREEEKKSPSHLPRIFDEPCSLLAWLILGVCFEQNVHKILTYFIFIMHLEIKLWWIPNQVCTVTSHLPGQGFESFLTETRHLTFWNRVASVRPV